MTDSYRGVSSNTKEEDFGLIRPSLIKQLRSILEEYPDDGQILKELIQNAEDARATEVKILYDEHTHGQDASKLHHPGLAAYQGPALYAYNNALFDEKDWKGIRLLQDSVKEKDPMKVGRFGLGFKSVLHMTDLPSVLSGNRLAIIDPHEKYFTFQGDKTTGYTWNLKERKDDLLKIQHQTFPYKGLFGSTEQTFQQAHFEGTLFRFPLRNKASALSDTKYTKDKIISLFESFKTDAHMILMFLCSLEKIELYQRSSKELKPSLQFRVEIDEKCLGDIRNCRENFTKSINPSIWMQEPVSVTFPLLVKTTDCSLDGTVFTKEHKWLVTLYYAGGDASLEIKELHSDPSLLLLPSVGCAMEYGKKTPETEEESDSVAGQVFCFLPLPIEEKSSTGLPVHVNGYFSISHNRRHLKWPSKGQNTGSDKAVRWNQCLLKEVIHKAYISLVKEAIKMSVMNKTVLSTADIYRSLPDIVSVHEKWQSLLEPFYIQLFHLPVIFTENNQGSWVTPNEAIFNCLKDKSMESLLVGLLLATGHNVANIPDHILHALGAFSRMTPEIISPCMVRNVLKVNPTCYKDLSQEEKILLLKYIVMDHDYVDLDGIALLPLKSGEFDTFMVRNGDKVYMPSKDFPAELLPGLEDCLVAQVEKTSVLKSLRQITEEGALQLCHLDSTNFPMLLQKVFHKVPRESLELSLISLPCDGAPWFNSKWLDLLWKCIVRYFSDNIDMFDQLPILPLNVHFETVVKLRAQSKVVLKEAVGYILDDEICNLLTKIGLYVAEDLPKPVKEHPQMMNRYARLPLSEDILDTLLDMADQTGVTKFGEIFLEQTTADEKRSFRNFVNSGMQDSSHKKMLLNLPVFEAIPKTEGEDTKFVAANDVSFASERPTLSCRSTVTIPNDVIWLSDDSSLSLARKLGLKLLKEGELVVKVILPPICTGTFPYENLCDIMKVVLQKLPLYLHENPVLSDELGKLNFIKTNRGTLEAPSNLYDPKDTIIGGLFRGEAVFPTDIYAEDEMISVLKQLGLRDSKRVQALDIFQSALRLEGLSCSPDDTEAARAKSMAMIEYLEKNPDDLDMFVEGELLRNWLRDVHWVAAMDTKPEYYPESLPLYQGPISLHRPGDVKQLDCLEVAGSVAAVGVRRISDIVVEKLDMDKQVTDEQVILHLKNVAKHYCSNEKAKYLSITLAIYNKLMGSLKNGYDIRKKIEECGLSKWIWNGEGFSSIDAIVMTKQVIELRPYLYMLPEELLPYQDLFLHCKVQSEIDESTYLNILHQIKEKHSQCSIQSDDSWQADLHISITILNKFKTLYPDGVLDDIRDQLVLPVKSKIKDTLQFLPLQKCTYCDVDWLRQGFDLMQFDEDDDMIFIHPDIPLSTAECLAVPSLMSRMLDAEELNISGFGQAEPLTTRLKRLVEEYTDGTPIFKELIQNADDAGATEVKFFYDERTNSEHMTYLIDEGMKHCQGPSLWCYNNAVFTDVDFENITKLGGATKECMAGKIGKFGLGFNAVYNLTDVPSFISKDSMVIFDPHTTHLGRGIRNKGKPGIRIDLRKNKTLIKKLPDQFFPYQGICGLKISENSEENYFDGTLFRIPLRSQYGAANSEICDLHYSHEEMVKLLKMFEQKAHDILLFTQNVQKVSIMHLQSDAQDVSEATEIFSVGKELNKILKFPALSHQLSPEDKAKLPTKSVELAEVSNMLTATASFVNCMKSPKTAKYIDMAKAPRSVYIIETHVTGHIGRLFLQTTEAEKDKPCEEHSMKYWLISFVTGESRSLTLSLQLIQEGLVPAAAVALPIIPLPGTNQLFTLPDSVKKNNEGSLFCFLPLPVRTGLPVHINAMFALQSNRRMLSVKTEDDKSSKRSDWNESLLEDACTLAYIQLLESCACLVPSNEMFDLTCLWPSKTSISKDTWHLVKGFYSYLSSTEGVPLACKDGKRIALQNAKILDPKFTQRPEIAKCVIAVCQILLPDVHIIQLPNDILDAIKKYGTENIIANKTLHLVEFYLNIFLPGINDLDAHERDHLVYFGLQLQDPHLNNLFMEVECIPASPTGEILKKPSELIHTDSDFVGLYDEADGKYVHQESLLFSVNASLLLGNVGLQKEVLCWNDIVERAQSVPAMKDNQPKKALHRSRLLLIVLENTLGNSADKDVSAYQEILKNTAFLPVLEKPKTYPLQWFNEESDSAKFVTPLEIYPPSSVSLVGSSKPILSDYVTSDKHMSNDLMRFLGLYKPVPVECALEQFNQLLTLNPEQLSHTKTRIEAEKICQALYAYFQNKCQESTEFEQYMGSTYGNKECILMHDKFVSPDCVALTFSYECAPYLYGVNQNYKTKYQQLFKVLTVREYFTSADYIGTLKCLNEKGQGLPLEKPDLDISLKLARLLNTSMGKEKVTVSELQEDFGVIYMPDSRGVLKPTSDLCYNDCPWVSENPQMNFTHPDITYQVSSNLGVKTKRIEALGKHSRGIPFGQKERLTNSLKRIIATYPDNHEILFELIQNADDAKATTIHFIKDTRVHPNKKLFEKSWNLLQGPALCVFNDRPFSREDLEGIQNLGEGSKTENPNKTGQYGTGFSTVYHLTDVPSILTHGTELGETLCVFDPNCLYVPNATAAAPGMRYDNLEFLRQEFPDVFSSYLPGLYDMKDSTMFRFPLRSKPMCRTSKISQKEISPSMLQSILNSLSAELFDVLLFLNHINSIVVAEINPQTGDFASYYHVTAAIQDEDMQKRQAFAAYLNKMSRKLRAGEINVEEIPLQQLLYTLEISDNEGRVEKWMVAQRVGFSEEVKLSPVLQEACEQGELNLMPRGGVACMLERRKHGRPQHEGSDGKVHCFLPLPLTSGLPVNINGHFAFGHENRRHLWTMDKGSQVHSEWNHLLCSEVIAPTYVDLLENMRMFGWKTKIENSSCLLTCAKPLLDSYLQTYLGYFPNFNDMLPQWHTLVQSTYEFIMKNDVELLPSVQELQSSSSTDYDKEKKHIVKWLPSHGTEGKTAFVSQPAIMDSGETSVASKSFLGKLRGYFAGNPKTPAKSEYETTKEVLLSCGLNLLIIPDKVVESFARAGIPLRRLAPENVLAFFAGCSTSEGSPFAGLPKLLAQTPFRNESTFKIIWNYCRETQNFWDNLENVPLAYCADEKLRSFGKQDTYYFTKFDDLVPQAKDKLLHRSIVDVANVQSEQGSFVVPFSTEKLSCMLEGYLPKDVYYDTKAPVEWVKRFNSIPSEAWVRKLWTFVNEEARNKKMSAQSSEDDLNDEGNAKKSPSTPEKDVKWDEESGQLLQPLMNWCVLPSKTQTKNFLTPLCNAGYVMDMSNAEYTLQNLLKRVGVQEVDKNAINSMHTTGVANIDMIRPSLANFEKPDRVLTIIHKQHLQEPERFKLTNTECDTLMNYFNKHVDKLNDESADMLASLPIFKTICGDIINLTGCIVYTLPAKIPTNDMDVWQSKSGTVFLERKENFQRLYDLLHCASISLTEVYCQFVLQHFDYLSQDARLKHLHYLYEEYMKPNANQQLPQEEKNQLSSILSNMPLLEDQDGDLQPAREFYDPNNELFQVMIPPEKFMPRAQNYFRESEWVQFLGQLGLVKEVSSEQVLQFVNQVAEEGKQPSGTPSALSRSKVLVQHLFALPQHTRNPLLEEIRDVAFIAGESVSRELKNLSSQYGDWGAGPLPFIKFSDSISQKYERLTWTKASILPRWADPLYSANLPQEEQAEIMDILKIQKEPQAITVVEHFVHLCNSVSIDNHIVREIEIVKTVFREIYRYLNGNPMFFNQDGTDSTVNLKSAFQDVPCLLVEEGKRLILPRQAAVNLYEEEEIHPYLYKLPANLGEFQTLFIHLGTTMVASVDQYGRVMHHLYGASKSHMLLPNELLVAMKAMKGIFSCLEKRDVRGCELETLYFPSEGGKLVDASELVFNDTPAFYDRLTNFKKSFMCDPRECGIRVYNFEELLAKLPAKYRPNLLSSMVKDTLEQDIRNSASTEGLALNIQVRLSSEEFMKALARLIRHECYTSGQEVKGPELYSVIDRLQTVRVFGVDKVIMALEVKGKRVKHSEKETSCFVEKYEAYGSNEMWRIFVRKDAVLSQDLLIKLADVINTILKGMLKKSVLYVIPLLTCEESAIIETMDNFNIWTDHQAKAVKQNLLPKPGQEIPEDIRQNLKMSNDGTCTYSEEQYVGYAGKDTEDKMVYAVVTECLGPGMAETTSQLTNMYLIDIGDGKNAVIANESNLFSVDRA